LLSTLIDEKCQKCLYISEHSKILKGFLLILSTKNHQAVEIDGKFHQSMTGGSLEI